MSYLDCGERQIGAGGLNVWLRRWWNVRGVSGECLQVECSEKVGIGVNGAVNGGGRRGGGGQQR